MMEGDGWYVSSAKISPQGPFTLLKLRDLGSPSFLIDGSSLNDEVAIWHAVGCSVDGQWRSFSQLDALVQYIQSVQVTMTTAPLSTNSNSTSVIADDTHIPEEVAVWDAEEDAVDPHELLLKAYEDAEHQDVDCDDPNDNLMLQKKKRRKVVAPPPTHVYVTGLPTTATPNQIANYFSKCGVIKRDPITDEVKVKLYRKEDGSAKGDALVTYLKEASVALAVDILDESEWMVIDDKGSESDTSDNEEKVFSDDKPKEDHTSCPATNGEADAPTPRKCILRVSRAAFNHELPKKSKGKPQAKPGDTKIKKKCGPSQEEVALSWADYRSDKAARVVIISGLWDPASLEDAARETFFQDLRSDLYEECSRYGSLEGKVKVFEHNPLGVVAVKFQDAACADRCLQVMNGRWFAQRQLSATLYDGVTNYNMSESKETEAKRMQGWETWLQGDDNPKS